MDHYSGMFSRNIMQRGFLKDNYLLVVIFVICTFGYYERVHYCALFYSQQVTILNISCLLLTVFIFVPRGTKARLSVLRGRPGEVRSRRLQIAHQVRATGAELQRHPQSGVLRAAQADRRPGREGAGADSERLGPVCEYRPLSPPIPISTFFCRRHCLPLLCGCPLIRNTGASFPFCVH